MQSKIDGKRFFSFYKAFDRIISGPKGYRYFSRKDLDNLLSVGRIIVTEENGLKKIRTLP